MKHPFGTALYSLEKPGRYIGREYNAVYKAIEKDTVRIGLVYPEVYEIGMSNLGLKIIYHICNREEGVYCERAFLPWIDAIELMRKENIPLFTLETYTPLKELDIIGFSLHTELNYTNVLLALELAEIPLLKEERDSTYPLIMVGGPASFNPLPLQEFVDFFIVGEGEAVLPRIIPLFKAYKRRELNKELLLKELSGYEGVYVPGISQKGKRAIAFELKAEDYPVKQVVPNIQIVHHRLVIEIMRGCTRGCRFCEGGFVYRPIRWREPEQVLFLLDEGIKTTGFSEASLLAFTTSDYPFLHELIFRIKQQFPDLALSLPSLPVDALDEELFELLNSMKRFNITLAPETVSERLRRVINKNVPLEKILKTIELASKFHYDHIKLYFMIGLPTETFEDIKLIPPFLKELKKAGRRIKFHVKISPFVPRPHTPFERERQERVESIFEKLKYLKSEIKRIKGVYMSYHNPYQSLIEGILGRGDQEAGELLLKAYKEGAIFDEREEFFSIERYKRAAEKLGKELYEFSKDLSNMKQLPWHIIDTGILRGYLNLESKRAKRGEYTGNCEYEGCKGCSRWIRTYPLCQRFPIKLPSSVSHETVKMEENKIFKGFLIRFRKYGVFKYIGHRETVEAFIMALRRAGWRIERKRGFKRHWNISLKDATPFGIESDAEFIFIRAFEGKRDLSELNKYMPEGIEVLEIREADKKELKTIKYAYKIYPSIDIEPNEEFHLIKKQDYTLIIPKTDKGILKFLSSILKMPPERILKNFNIVKTTLP